MHKPDPVEAILARLMPPGLSEAGQAGIEAMLDELGESAQSIDSPKPADRSWTRRVIGGGIAAAGVAAALMAPWNDSSKSTISSIAVPIDCPSEFVLVGESDRIESMTDEGWQETSDGTTVRAVRLNVVEENSLLDEETGMVMQVSEPREEILLMPVSAF